MSIISISVKWSALLRLPRGSLLRAAPQGWASLYWNRYYRHPGQVKLWNCKLSFEKFEDLETVIRNAGKFNGTETSVREGLRPASQGIRKSQFPQWRQPGRKGKQLSSNIHASALRKEQSVAPEMLGKNPCFSFLYRLIKLEFKRNLTRLNQTLTDMTTHSNILNHSSSVISTPLTHIKNPTSCWFLVGPPTKSQGNYGIWVRCQGCK